MTTDYHCPCPPLPATVCLFERTIGDPSWRHAEYERDNTVDGRAQKELVVRYASTVGNYDYLVDYIFSPDGTITMGVGSTGIDAVKGVAVTSMDDPGAADETRFGTLLAPNLVGVYHAHYFNYRLDFDIDGDEHNTFRKAHLSLTKTADLDGVHNIPRKSIWTVDYETVETEIAARTKINPAAPSNWYFGNPNVKSALGHTPSYQLLPGGSYAYSLLDSTDPPVARNAYIDHQLYVTKYDPDQIYAGGEYAFQSDGSDNLHVWSAADRNINNEDIVAWYTVGFHHGTLFFRLFRMAYQLEPSTHHHRLSFRLCLCFVLEVPRMEDWPVMPLHKVYFQVRPFNFFPYNPAMSLPVKATTVADSAVATTTTTDGATVTADVVIVKMMTHRNYWITAWLVVAAAAFGIALYRAMRAPCGVKKYHPISACEQQPIMPR
jgi:primary-amine oxidase